MTNIVGHFVRQPSGYKAFIPAPFPPTPPFPMTPALVTLLSSADLAVGRLDATGDLLPNPALFVGMFAKQEAVLSSQIEGTQSTLDDILRYEVDTATRSPDAAEPKQTADLLDVQEVLNYLAAMEYGIERLATLPLSLRFLREVHTRLMQGVRGAHKSPGEFRKTQNWIGGATLSEAAFVPPPVPEMMTSLGDLEKFLHRADVPVLIQAGMAHAQFETIHPFLDGNGRVGRLLIGLLLCSRGVLRQPILYLSRFFRDHRPEYYDGLMRVRTTGDWTAWLEFFLTGVTNVANQAVDTTRRVRELRADAMKRIEPLARKKALAIHLLDLLFITPVVTLKFVQEKLECDHRTASAMMTQFTTLGLVRESTGFVRNRRYANDRYLALFNAARDHEPETQTIAAAAMPKSLAKATPKPRSKKVTKPGRAKPAAKSSAKRSKGKAAPKKKPARKR